MQHNPPPPIHTKITRHYSRFFCFTTTSLLWVEASAFQKLLMRNLEESQCVSLPTLLSFTSRQWPSAMRSCVSCIQRAHHLRPSLSITLSVHGRPCLQPSLLFCTASSPSSEALLVTLTPLSSKPSGDFPPNFIPGLPNPASALWSGESPRALPYPWQGFQGGTEKDDVRVPV